MTRSWSLPVDPPRELTDQERQLLAYLLSQPFPGGDELLHQAGVVRVGGECRCGCGTIDLVVPGRPEGLAPAGHQIPVVAGNRDDSAAPVEVLLHTVNGVLRELEVIWYGDASRRDRHRVTPVMLTMRA